MRHKINVCFDLDGPIIDVSGRYYQSYLESLHGVDISKDQILSKHDFWKFKQNRVSDIEIGILSGLTIKEAKGSAEIRKRLTFSTEYLKFDSLFDDVYEIFNFLMSEDIVFYIATLRRESQLTSAIKQFKLDKYVEPDSLFSLSDGQSSQNDIQEKYGLFFNAVNQLHLNPQETWVIGDSDTDIHAARLARYKNVIGITRGVRSKEQLKMLKPDHLVSNLTEFMHLLQKQI